MFVVTVAFSHPEAARARFLELVAANAARSLADEPGCRRFDVCLDAGGDVFLYELYDDAAAFEAHRAMPHYRDFIAASAPLGGAKRVATYMLHPGGSE